MLRICKNRDGFSSCKDRKVSLHLILINSYLRHVYQTLFNMYLHAIIIILVYYKLQVLFFRNYCKSGNVCENLISAKFANSLSRENKALMH